MDLDLSGRVIAVTGASRGTGLAIAAALAMEGAHVAIAARSPQHLAAAHARIEAEGAASAARCLAYACDLAQAGEAAAFIETVVEVFGRLDGLVCLGEDLAPGGNPGRARTAVEVQSALTLVHAVEALQAAARALGEADGAALLVSSVPTHGQDPKDRHHVVASALASAAQTMTPELARPGIRVNALIAGRIVAESDGGTPQEADAIADAAVFLVSPRSAVVNGAVISVAGRG